MQSHPTHSSTAAHYIFVHRGWGTEGVLIGITLLPSGPTGMIAVRLNEVRPDGASARVTFGLLNLAHRGGDSAHPVPMQPGRVEVVTLRLNDAAYTFGVGCRLRLAISTRCNLYSPTCRLGGRANRLTSAPHTHTALIDVSISTLHLLTLLHVAAVACSYWPMAWPTNPIDTVTLSLHTAGSSLTVPLRAAAQPQTDRPVRNAS